MGDKTINIDVADYEQLIEASVMITQMRLAYNNTERTQYPSDFETAVCIILGLSPKAAK